ncbi:MAG: PhnD/SsuA/transferrin family substrate-binding protein [Campylobacterota bacterium]|nr:PhnD/SsuA/transferrin family substrate-binding protein [Campylobacterota bacterium]
MKLLNRSLLVITLLFTSVFATDSKTIYFTPLPMKNEKKTIEEFLPLMDYMEKELSLKIKFNYKKDYSDILDGFIDGSIDIAYLGPLPFATLKSKYPYIKPIVAFKHQDGTISYRCVISKFSKDKFDPSQPLRVALTQTLSTCGYYSTQKLLQERFGIDLSKQKYSYEMSHTNALIGVMKEKFIIAGSSEDIAKKHESLGMEIIATTEPLPAFSIVVNTKTLSVDEIKKISQTLLNIPHKRYKTLGKRVQYGVLPVSEKLYDTIDTEEIIPQKGNIQ